MKGKTMNLGAFFKKLDRKPEEPASRAVTLTENRPEWLFDAVRDAHDGTLPNDWIYEECQAVCDAIDDGSLATDDDIHEHADGRVDVYTQNRFGWAECFCLQSLFAEAEEQAKDCGGESTDVAEHLGRVQYFAIERIARVIFEAYQSSQDETSESAEV
jgi:hypothetical protein